MSGISHTDNDLGDADHGGASRRRGGAVTFTTVIGLLLATGLTIFGVGAADNAVANFDASSWLWSSTRGEVDRVNGITTRVDTRAKIKDARNHEIQISQTDRYLILRDLTTGQVSSMDLTTLQVNAVMQTTAGLGVNVALHGEVAYVIDSVQGLIRQLDPHTLAPTGDSLVFPPGLSAGAFDSEGVLWVAVPSEGTVAAILAGTNGTNPKVLRTVTVAQPRHDLEISVLDHGVAVLDNTAAQIVTVKGDTVKTTTVPIDKPATVPARSSGTPIPVTVTEDRHVFVVAAGQVRDFTVPGTGPLDPAVAFAGHFYCADPSAGIVYEINADGDLVTRIRIPGAGGALELEVRENHLFINAPDSSTARVVDEHHKVSAVNKYDNGVLGGDPPPAPPSPPPPSKPVITAPGKPRNVQASAGDASVRVTWGKAAEHGAAITKYVVQGAGQTLTVGAKQRSVDVAGLTNGETYRFTVYAVNAKGAGPKATSNRVVPTSDVPDPPTTVAATANPDGTVEVGWPAANGQGRAIVRYTVTSVSGGAETPIGETNSTTLAIPAGALDYGTQYAFTVVAVNDKGAGSESSPASNTVVPFTAPGAPVNLTATAVADKRGTIQISWRAAADNGRAITGYRVRAGTQQQETTGTALALSGFGDDEAVQVSVVAVNEAGEGKAASTGTRTIGVPTLTFTGDGAGYNSLTVTFTPNNKNGSAVCKVAVSGAGAAQTNCTTTPVTLMVAGLWPNKTYNYTISVTTAAGAATDTHSTSTNTLKFAVICPNNAGGYCNAGIWAYQVPSQQQSSKAVNPSMAIGATGTPQCHLPGDSVNAKPWGAKNSNQWLRFTYRGGTAYFPWAWATLDGGDRLSMIPPC